MDRILALVIFSLMPFLTWAETIPATSGYQPAIDLCIANDHTHVCGCIGDADYPGCSPSLTCGSPRNQTKCWKNAGGGYSSIIGPANLPIINTCPSNQGWILSGSNCTRPDCVAGEIRDANGICTADCAPKQGDTFIGYVTGTGSPAIVSQSGCEATVVQASNQCIVNDQPATCGVWQYTGQPNTTATAASNQPPQAGPCPSGKCRGEVNGQLVCLACSGTSQGTQISATTTVDADGNKTVTVTETVYGDTISSNTTTTTFNSGGTQTGQTQEQQTDPTDKPSDECRKNPDLVGCAKLGSLDDATPAPTQTPVSITPQAAWGNAGQCPQDVVLNVMGQSVPFKFSGACQFFQLMNPVVLAAAWVSALFIFIGGVRTES
jgi:hypothetical protein